MVPYTYYLFHVPTRKKYYGVQYSKKAHPNNLWKTYFSSSKSVKKLIEQYGKDSFKVEIRKTFSSQTEALCWEQRVLQKLNVPQKEEWLNVHIHGSNFYQIVRTPEHQKKIADANRGQKRRKWKHSEETKKKMSDSKKGKKLSEEHIKKIIEAHNRPEVIEKHSKAMKGKPSNMLGKKHSAETKLKISITEKITKGNRRVP